MWWLEVKLIIVFVSLYFLQLTLTPAQQQLLLQQAQAQLLAAAVQHSAGQQSSTTGASISASAATPITLSQPIQITPVREPRFIHPSLSTEIASFYLIVATPFFQYDIVIWINSITLNAKLLYYRH